MVTYGQGEMIFDGTGSGFQIAYKGNIQITESPDNLFISANENMIIGIMLDGNNLPDILFEYIGNFKLLSFSSTNNNTLERQKINISDLGYWRLNANVWELDTGIWESKDTDYIVNKRVRYNKHSLVVNNNLKTSHVGQFTYKDESDVEAGLSIHIHSDGTTMTEGVHTENSVEIYRSKDAKSALKILPIKQTRITSPVSSGSSGSGGGGGY